MSDGEPTFTRKGLPEPGDLVIATVTRIEDYGAYLTLDEYDSLEGLLHISEISSSWVKNIRDHVRERQKLVLKVLRVDPDKRHIDLSLRRVSGKEKQEKLLEWKRRRKAISILEMAAAEVKVEPALLEETLEKLEERFGEAYEGLEEIVEKGEDALEKLKLPREWSTAILKVVQQKVKLPTVRIKGVLELSCPRPDGVEVIKKVLAECRSLRKARRGRVEIYSMGAPRYAVEVTAKDYKEAERIIGEIADHAVKEIGRTGGEGKFFRK